MRDKKDRERMEERWKEVKMKKSVSKRRRWAWGAK